MFIFNHILTSLFSLWTKVLALLEADVNVCYFLQEDSKVGALFVSKLNCIVK